MRQVIGIIIVVTLLATALVAQQQSGTSASGKSVSAGRQLQSIAGQPVLAVGGGVLGRSLLDNYVAGDADGNQMINITDAVVLVVYIFNGGSEPYPYVSGDANCDGLVNIADATYLVAYIFGSNEPPVRCY